MPKASTYCRIERDWQDGDTIELTFDSSVSVVKDPAGSDFICLTKGIYTLVQDKRFSPDADKPAPLKLVDGKPVWKPATLKDVNVAIDVLLEDGTYRRFVDYASAGKTFDSKTEIKTWFKQK